MTAVMDRPTMALLNEQATATAEANPPSQVALTVVAFIFTAVGWVIGRSWFFLAKAIAFSFLAARYGYRQGLKIPVEVRPASPSIPQ